MAAPAGVLVIWLWLIWTVREIVRRPPRSAQRAGGGLARYATRVLQPLVTTRIALIGFLLLALLWPPGAAAAQEESPVECSVVEYGAGAEAGRPPNPFGPTRVGAGLFVTELRDIDAVADDFLFRGYVRTTWCDPREAFRPGKGATSDERIFLGPRANEKRESMWTPGGYPVNQVSDMDVSERVIRIRSDGTVSHDLNVNLRLDADYDLRRFPFDRQTLDVQVESFTWNRDHVQWIADDTITGFAEGLEIPEWRIVEVSSRAEEVPVIRSEVPFSRYTLLIEVERRAGFYLWKVILPLLIIVALSWSVFWMPDERFAGRSRISATGVLTIVAYQFVIAEDLPRVAYLTLLDKMMIISFGVLAVTVLESLLVSRHQDANPERAHRIDARAKWLFPLTYAVMLALAWFTTSV